MRPRDVASEIVAHGLVVCFLRHGHAASPQYGFGKAERRWRERARRRPRDQCREAERCHRQPATRLLSRISSART
jgi:hypothetical protein